MIPFEIPNPFNMKRALFIQPHHDDNEFGAGATIAKLASEGVDVHYLTVTDGGSGSNDKTLSTKELIEIRKKEQEKASSILGVNQLHWLDFPDGHLYDSEELRRELVRVIRTVCPDIIFTVDPWLDYETHIDHIVTGKVASFAARMSGNARFYPEQLQADLKEHKVQVMGYYTTKNPNTFINVDSFWEKKLKALQAHKSQFSGDYLTFITNYLSYKATEHAKQVEDDCNYAEGFKILPLMFLHSNVDAIDM
ncbi:PIG-L deacetylase family protein [Oceanobacillus jeddahense]|uniref:PIG-L deacetylase family protein n=1 Tax=Oceanobacillus jeddahense TaxID=1462527 RepID=UPI000694A709|nr:PIG-L deacetylase family protein [Oceanobacillus jeddahense]